MKIITVEEHFANAEIVEANAKYGDPSGMLDLPEKVREAYNGMRFTGDALLDVDNIRFAFMDKQKVNMQILSYTAPVSDMVPADEAVALCKKANDILAEVVQKYPEKFSLWCKYI